MRRFALPALTATLLSLFGPAATADAAVLCDVSGSVVTAAGTGVPGVEVWFGNDGGNRFATSGPAGGFSFPTVCGDATLQLSWSKAPLSYLPAVAMLRGKVEVADGGTFALRLPPAVTAAFTVTDEAGAPVAGAGVWQANEDTIFSADDATVLAGAPKFDVWVDLAGRRTDAAGKASYRTFPNSTMEMMIHPPAGSPLQRADIVVNASTNVSRTVKLSKTPAGAALSGVVRDAQGNGVPHVIMGASGDIRYWNTDATGAFTVYGPAGPAQLWGSLQSFETPPPPNLPAAFSFGPIPVTRGSAGPVEVTLPPVSHARLTIQPPPGHTVSYVHLSTNHMPNSAYLSDPAVLVPGTPAVPVSTTVGFQYGSVIEFDVFKSSALDDLRLVWENSDGDSQELDLPPLDLSTDLDTTIVLPPPPTKHVVTGTLTDADGQPVTGGFVRTQHDFASADANGRFSLPVIEGRTVVSLGRDAASAGWTVNESLPDGFAVDVPLGVTGPTELALKLPRAHEVTFRALDPVDRSPVQGAWLAPADDYNPFEVGAMTLAGTAGPGVASVRAFSGPTDASGEIAFRTWPVQQAAELQLGAQYAGMNLRSRIVGLEVTGNKTLELVLGTSKSPTTYQRPGNASGVTAVSEPSASPAPASAVRTANAPARTVDATVRWAAPRNVGGTRITGYRVTASPGGKTVKVGSSARSATLQGLSATTKYSFTVRAVNGIGPARGTSAPLDVAVPRTTLTAPAADLVMGGTAKATWKGTDDASGIAGYDVRVRSAAAGAGFGRYAVLAGNTKATSQSFGLKPGQTSCVSVRARDRVGHVGAWSVARCVSRPLDDAALAASGPWAKVSGADYYGGAASRSTSRGAALRLGDVTAQTLWVVATTCPTCGTVTVRHAGVVVARLDLRAATTQHRVRLRIDGNGVRSGAVSVMVSDPRKGVRIDGLAVRRAA